MENEDKDDVEDFEVEGIELPEEVAEEPEHEEQVKEAISGPSTHLLAEIVTAAIRDIFEMIAYFRQLEVWKFDKEGREEKAWLNLWIQVLPHIPIKYFGIIISIMDLAVIQIKKGVADFNYHKVAKQ